MNIFDFYMNKNWNKMKTKNHLKFTNNKQEKK